MQINPGGYGIPIGLFKDGNDWKWSDGSASNYQQWNLGNSPTLAKCVIMDNGDPDFHWWGVSCTDSVPRFAYICYSDPVSLK